MWGNSLSSSWPSKSPTFLPIGSYYHDFEVYNSVPIFYLYLNIYGP